jgi:Ca2+-binding RTX toxin-like protein
MIGGAGRDIFDFNSIAETRTGATRDVIVDFTHGNNVTGDDIDLRGIDAQAGVAGNQAFHFIGAQSFHHAKGELRYVKVGTSVIVQGDLNGDAKADFEILVQHHTSLAAGDFLL